MFKYTFLSHEVKLRNGKENKIYMPNNPNNHVNTGARMSAGS